MQHTPLSQNQLDALDQWLQSDQTPAETLPLDAVRGLLFAVNCAPEPVDVEQWMTVIFAGDSEIQPPDDQVFALVGLFNDISEQIYVSGDVLDGGLAMADKLKDNFRMGCQAHEWCLGFTLGLNFYHDKLADNLEDEELLNAFGMTNLYLSLFSSKQIAETAMVHAGEVDLKGFLRQAVSLIPEFARGYAQLIEQVALATGLFEDDEGDDW